jgi:hypothetical protein
MTTNMHRAITVRICRTAEFRADIDREDLVQLTSDVRVRGWRGALNETLTEGLSRGGSTSRHAKFGEDVRDVGFHRTRTNEQCFRDLRVGSPLDEETEDIHLAGGQGGVGADIAVVGWPGPFLRRHDDVIGQGDPVPLVQALPHLVSASIVRVAEGGTGEHLCPLIRGLVQWKKLRPGPPKLLVGGAEKSPRDLGSTAFGRGRGEPHQRHGHQRRVPDFDESEQTRTVFGGRDAPIAFGRREEREVPAA